MRLKRIICVLLAALMISAGLAGCGEDKKTITDTKTIEFSTTQLNEIESQIDKILATKNFQGAAMVKLNKNMIYDKGIGVANNHGDKITDKTVFSASSLTRAITGVAVYKLVDQKKLSLDTSIDKYFSGGEYLSEITVGQLLSGSVRFVNYVSSITNNSSLDAKLRKAYQKKDDEKIKRLIAADIIARGKALGTGTVYSNYYLLGLIIEKASGVSYKKFVQTEIFDKVGMKDSGFIKTDGDLKAFDMNNNRWRNQREKNFWASYGFHFSSYGVTTSARDMMKFCTELLAGKLCKTDIVKSVRESGTSYNCGINENGRNLYINAKSYYAAAYVTMNPDDLEITVLISNHTGKNDINTTGKEVAQTIKTKINGIVLDNA